MTGTIKQIDPEKQGPLGRFIRIHFVMSDGSYRMLDCVRKFQNFRHWQQFLEIGITLSNLHPMGANKLNADPIPVRVDPLATPQPETEPEPISPQRREETKPEPSPQLNLL